MGRLAKSIVLREIWEKIVGYANADLSNADYAENFDALYRECLRWIDPGAAGKLKASIPSAFSIEANAVFEGEQSVEVLVAKHQQDIRNVLRWLSRPGQVGDPDAAKDALVFLRRNVESIKWEFHVNDSFDPNRRGAAFYVAMPMEFPSIMSPFCLFIWRQIGRYREGDGELKEVIPVELCERPGCGRFFIVERLRRGRFCGSNCRAMDWQAKHPSKDEMEDRGSGATTKGRRKVLGVLKSESRKHKRRN